MNTPKQQETEMKKLVAVVAGAALLAGVGSAMASDCTDQVTNMNTAYTKAVAIPKTSKNVNKYNEAANFYDGVRASAHTVCVKPAEQVDFAKNDKGFLTPIQ